MPRKPKPRIPDDTPLGHLIDDGTLAPRTVTALVRSLWTVGELRRWYAQHEAGTAPTLPYVGPRALADIAHGMRRIGR